MVDETARDFPGFLAWLPEASAKRSSLFFLSFSILLSYPKRVESFLFISTTLRVVFEWCVSTPYEAPPPPRVV
jgi:hypothetical protein